ncbi:hypothetical protein WJX72_010929 [[Myrmecia] bisecta]|uniref:Arp2/3 complex 41 kDa subunit n=1 Tax=[Myrmecia] bisecta TaxID=41462 RepID=A0AAW1Q6D6_9CHLO
MVITRLNRAALCVRWSPCERKFAIGSGAKSICVCYYEKENNWWASKLIRKKHESSVLSVAWHPSSLLIASASTDGKCRIFAAVIPGMEAETAETRALAGTKFGDVLLEVDAGDGWGLNVAWSPSGSQLACSSHNSTVMFLSGLDVTNLASLQRPGAGQHVKLPCLGLQAVGFVAEDRLVGGSFDGDVVLLVRAREGLWQFSHVVKDQATRSAAPVRQISAEFSAKLNMFRSQGQAAEPPADDRPQDGMGG